MIVASTENPARAKMLRDLDEKSSAMYNDVLIPLGRQYGMEILAPRMPQASKPTILFLGNHSSGKSSFINYLIGDTVQRTGIAPTDDGFTVIAHGSFEEQSSGSAAAKREEITVAGLDRLGPAFLSRLKLKLVGCESLSGMTLIDSPGMIDAATTAQARGYDFMAAVRTFAESADLVLFFLDPEKPGTTGETIAAFTQALSGMESKVLILMNKADTFSHIRDFARDYGALCWNLSRVIVTKDLPNIYTTYLPMDEQLPQRTEDRAIPLDGFDEAREEVLDQIRQALSRRFDNVISTLTDQAERLKMYIRVISRAQQTVAREKRLGTVLLFCFLALTFTISILLRQFDYGGQLISFSLLCGLGSATLAWIWARSRSRRRASTIVSRLDSLFDDEYRREFALGTRDDLRIRWQSVRRFLEPALAKTGMAEIARGNPRRNQRYQELQRLLDTDIAQLRLSQQD